MATTLRRGTGHKQVSRLMMERLEERRLLSSTLVVGPGPTDATHFTTLQAALSAAADGDTIQLVSGFDAGTFANATLLSDAAAGASQVLVNTPVSPNEVVALGRAQTSDPREYALVTAVSADGSGNYVLTLKNALAYSHTAGGPVNAGNNFRGGPAIGISKAVTLEGDPSGAAVVLGFDLEVWAGTSGVTLRHVNLAAGVGQNLWLSAGVTGTTVSDVALGNSLVLNGASGNLIDTVGVGHQLSFTASSGNTVRASTLAGGVQFASGSDGNAILGCTVTGAILERSGSWAPGGLRLEGNLLSNGVTLTGGTGSGDVVSGNTFSGGWVKLDHDDGAVVSGNTFTSAADGYNGVEAVGSQNVLVTGNQFTLSGAWATGVYAWADYADVTSVIVRDNALNAGSRGWGLYVGKWSATAGITVLVEGNDFAGSAMGVTVYGDGSGAGTVDLGGGGSVLGTSAGQNDFGAFASGDAGTYAVGLFGVSSDTVLEAQNNYWGVTDPMAAASTVLADGLHDLAAGGSGVIHATVGVRESIAAQGASLAGVEGAAVSGIVATFTDTNAARTAGDFLVTVDWGDGTTGTGVVSQQANGTFVVSGTHTYAVAGQYAVSVAVLQPGTGVNAVAASSVDVAARVLTATGVDVAATEGSAWTGVVARFTDNLPGATAALYSAQITWGDGTMSVGLVQADDLGGFEVVGTVTYSQEGTYALGVTITSADGHVLLANATAAAADGALAGQAVSVVVDKGRWVRDGVVATFVDLGGAEAASSYTALIDWGDGDAPALGTVVATISGFQVLGTHHFGKAGVFTVQVTITSAGGSSTTVDSTASTEMIKARMSPVAQTSSTSVSDVTITLVKCRK